MVGLILNILSRFFLPIKNLLIVSRSNTKNFAIFVASVAIINVLIRSVLIWAFSTPENIDLINRLSALFMITSCSVIFSIVFFYIQSNYPRFLRQFFSNLIDFERLDENKARREDLVHKLEVQFPNIRFDSSLFFYPLAIVWIVYSFTLRMYSTPWNYALGWFVWILVVLLIFYLRNVQKTILNYAEIPDELLYIPSKREKLWWRLKFISWETLQGVLFGENYVRRSNTEYEYYQRKIRTAKNYNTFNKVLVGALRLGALIGGSIGVEAYFFQHPNIPPSVQLVWKVKDGYYSNRAEVISQAFRLANQGCDMSTFCYPGTKKLDPNTVFEAYAYIKSNPSVKYENGTWTFIDVQVPSGPYQNLSVVDGKESTLMPPSTITSGVEEKEFPPIE